MTENLIPDEWATRVFARELETYAAEFRTLVHMYGAALRAHFRWLHMCSPADVRVVLLDGRALHTRMPYHDMHTESSINERGTATELWYALDADAHDDDKDDDNDDDDDDGGMAMTSADPACVSFSQLFVHESMRARCGAAGGLRYPPRLAPASPPKERKRAHADAAQCYGPYGLVAWTWKPPTIAMERSEHRHLLEMMWRALTNAVLRLCASHSVLWISWHANDVRAEMMDALRVMRPYTDVFLLHARQMKGANVYATINTFLQTFDTRAASFLPALVAPRRAAAVVPASRHAKADAEQTQG